LKSRLANLKNLLCDEDQEEHIAMRAALSLLAACAALAAACASHPNQANSTPPSSLSVLMPDNNVAATSTEAQNYCAQWSRGARYHGVQATAVGEVAVYTCDGARPGALSETRAPSSCSTVAPGAVGAPTVIAPIPRQ
jgi:hypothetical protein